MADTDTKALNPQALYGKGYFCGGEYADYLRDRTVFEKQFKDRLRTVKRFQSSGDLIEIGCAFGFFLAIAQGEYRVRGYDIAQASVAYARKHLGVDARCIDFLDARVDYESADVVVMWDTIEHLLRPDLVMKKIARVLRSGGFVFLTTGDIGSVLARIRRGKWRLFHPRTHLHYFSRKTITALLCNAGLQPVESRYIGVRRSVRQIVHSLLVGKTQPWWRLYSLVAACPVGNLSFVLNTYDIMLVVGMKPRQHGSN